MTKQTTPENYLGINFVAADNGAIKVWRWTLDQRTNKYHIGYDEPLATCTTVQDLTQILQAYGLDIDAGFSSSMDFASEYGFEDDDAAWAFLNAAINAIDCNA